jgi:hypothetical protein
VNAAKGTERLKDGGFLKAGACRPSCDLRQSGRRQHGPEGGRVDLVKLTGCSARSWTKPAMAAMNQWLGRGAIATPVATVMLVPKAPSEARLNVSPV